MAVNKQLVNYHINRLKSKSREVRLAAVEELRQLADIEALEPLKELYNSDDDAEVRKAAQEAGRHIFIQSRDS